MVLLSGTPKGSCYLPHLKCLAIWYTKTILLSGTPKRFCSLAHHEGLAVWHTRKVLLSSTPKRSCCLVHQKGLAIWHTKMVLLSGTSKWSCYLVHQNGLAIWYTKMVLLSGTPKRYCCLARVKLVSHYHDIDIPTNQLLYYVVQSINLFNICNKLNRYWCILNDIYRMLDEFGKHHLYLNKGVNFKCHLIMLSSWENVLSEGIVVALKEFEMSWSLFTNVFANLIW